MMKSHTAAAKRLQTRIHLKPCAAFKREFQALDFLYLNYDCTLEFGSVHFIFGRNDLKWIGKKSFEKRERERERAAHN